MARHAAFVWGERRAVPHSCLPSRARLVAATTVSRTGECFSDTGFTAAMLEFSAQRRELGWTVVIPLGEGSSAMRAGWVGAATWSPPQVVKLAHRLCCG